MPDILHEVTTTAWPDKIFKAITEQQGLAAWWTTHMVAEPKVGAMVEASFFGGQFTHKMEVVTLEPVHKVKWITRQGFPDWSGTYITWDLSVVESGDTKILFGHRGFTTADGTLPKVSYGWVIYLTSLKDYLEKGKGNPHSY